MAYILDRPLYLDSTKTRVLEEGDPDSAFVLGGKGSSIPDAEAERLGLKSAPGGSENKLLTPGAEDKTAAADTETEETETAADGAGDLPDDFPALSVLQTAGIRTYADLSAYSDDYTAIDGIGEVFAGKIGAAVK